VFVRRVIRAAAVVVLVAAAGCRKGEEAEAPAARVVARVADRQITAADVYRGLYPQGRPKEAKVDAEAARRVLDQLVERALILEWAGDNEIGAGDDEVNGRLGLIRADYGPRGFSSYLKSQGLTLDSFTEIIRDDLVVEAAIEAAVVEEVSVSYDDVVAYYNVHAEDFEALAEYHIKQIITDEKAKAEEALAKLEYGATFEEVAREMSMSPDRHMGGDVGYTTLDAVPPEPAGRSFQGLRGGHPHQRRVCQPPGRPGARLDGCAPGGRPAGALRPSPTGGGSARRPGKAGGPG